MSGQRKKYIAVNISVIIRAILLCLFCCCLMTDIALGQGSAQEEANGSGESGVQNSVYSDECIGPVLPDGSFYPVTVDNWSESTSQEDIEQQDIDERIDLQVSLGEGAQTGLEEYRRPPVVAVYQDADQQIPVIRSHGEYFDPSGICASGPMSEESNQVIRSRMLKTYEMGFRCFMLRVDWLSLEQEPNNVDLTRVQDLVEYAGELGLKVIISIDLNRVPAWFFKGVDKLGRDNSGRVTVSYLVDPEVEPAPGNDGDLRWSNGSGVPLLYHPGTMTKVENLIISLCNGLKDETALLGWHLAGYISLGFPGGGIDGIVGVSGYSPWTVRAFYDAFYRADETQSMVYPLPRYSQGTWDTRKKFQAFWNYRRIWRREAFESAIAAFQKADNKHLLLIGMNTVLNYRSDNGYLSMVQASDSTYQLLYEVEAQQSYENEEGSEDETATDDQGVSVRVDGVVINFKLASDTFDSLNDRSGSSAMHLVLTINQVIRNGRLAIVLIEPDIENPPTSSDIMHLAYMLKAAGAYPIWCSGYIQQPSHEWSWQEENAIERTQPLSLLPPPKRLRRGQVAIVDMPGLYSSFYAEQNGSLELALIQLGIHQKTGVVIEYVGEDELYLNEDPVLDRYKDIIVLSMDGLNREVADTTWLNRTTLNAFHEFSASGGIMRPANQLELHQYVLADYHSPVLEDEHRTRYVHRGATADLLNGADAFILANNPYIFIQINSLQGSRWIDIELDGWPAANLSRIDMVDLPDSKPISVDVVAGRAGFHFNPTHDTAHLFILTDDYAPVADLYEKRMIGVAIAQQSRQMRRSVPAALLLAALLAVTLIWMTFQSQQRSLLQAAELVDRRRRIEPIDILDEPEVMEFYKTYISDSDGSESIESDNTDPDRNLE